MLRPAEVDLLHGASVSSPRRAPPRRPARSWCRPPGAPRASPRPRHSSERDRSRRIREQGRRGRSPAAPRPWCGRARARSRLRAWWRRRAPPPAESRDSALHPFDIPSWFGRAVKQMAGSVVPPARGFLRAVSARRVSSAPSRVRRDSASVSPLARLKAAGPRSIRLGRALPSTRLERPRPALSLSEPAGECAGALPRSSSRPATGRSRVGRG